MDIKLILSIWGAGLSTILAVFTLIKYKKEYGIDIFIMAQSEKPNRFIEFSVCNKSKKPITLIEFGIGIGINDSNQNILINKKIESPITLTDSEIYSDRIERSELLKIVKNREINRRDFQKIWLNIKLSTGKELFEAVYINPDIITENYYNKAEQFIASDLFLGYEQTQSQIFPIDYNK